MMKKILVALAMFPMVAAADITPGTFELTGGSTLGFNSGSVEAKTDGAPNDKTDVTQYGLDVAGLYYVIPNLGVGLKLGYASTTAKNSGIEVGHSSYRIGPALSYEVPVAPQLAVFGRGDVGYVSSTTTRTGAADLKETGFGLGLEAGVKYFVVKNFSFDAALGYSYENVKDDVTPKTTTTTSGFGLNVGLSVYFGGASH